MIINMMCDSERSSGPFTLISQGPISQFFKQKNINDFFDAIEWVHNLPYGRNSDRANYMLIFKELRGTCSTKHAALAALAKENNIEATLQLAICKLTPEIEPRSSHFLQKIECTYFPEAHCYLKVKGQNIDITFPNQSPYLRVEILEEYTILPAQIGEYKLQLHHKYLQDWLLNFNPTFSFKEIWQLREEWIATL